MAETLSQEQLNAARIISALAELIAVNTNPQYGWGRETLGMVRQHLRGWDYHNRTELRAAIDRILVPPATLAAVDPVVGIVAPGLRATKDSSSPSKIVVPEAESGPAWQPIATAPRDGREILLYDGERVSYGGFCDAAAQGVDECEAHLISEGWWSVGLIDNAPTHWMPLPAPPSAALLVPAAPQGEGRHSPMNWCSTHHQLNQGATCPKCVAAAPPEPETKNEDLSRLPGVPGSEHGDPRGNRNERNP